MSSVIREIERMIVIVQTEIFEKVTPFQTLDLYHHRAEISSLISSIIIVIGHDCQIMYLMVRFDMELDIIEKKVFRTLIKVEYKQSNS